MFRSSTNCPGPETNPNGTFFRKPAQTGVRIYQGKVNAGRQIYIVYPLISESEKSDYKNLEAGYELMREVFPRYKISMVHGKMKPADKDAEMQLFKEGKTQIMVATTVIEVGVDVPNASVMIIESAERFGLSQLHQLRGRVGRGASQSYCILMSSYKISNESRKRLETMVRTNDGFEIAEVDMQLRGPETLKERSKAASVLTCVLPTWGATAKSCSTRAIRHPTYLTTTHVWKNTKTRYWSTTFEN
jgi:ATP-dependent DNA helicase RecG